MSFPSRAEHLRRIGRSVLVGIDHVPPEPDCPASYARDWADALDELRLSLADPAWARSPNDRQLLRHAISTAQHLDATASWLHDSRLTADLDPATAEQWRATVATVRLHAERLAGPGDRAETLTATR